jgi:hypothetical protein
MNEEEFERILEEAEKSAPPMFHPVHERADGAWFPGNDAATIASIISHAWEDIGVLLKLRKEVNLDYEKKLLFKYIIIELRSVIEQLDKLQSIIFQIIKGGDSNEVPPGYISLDESNQIKSLFKKYHQAKNKIEPDLVSIRNNIGAHRGSYDWKNVVDLWDKLEPDSFKELFEVLPELFNYLVKLDIYDWTRIPREGSIEICCSGLNRP